MRVGNRDVVHTASLLIPEGEDAWVEFLVGDWPLKLNIVFKAEADNIQPRVTVEAVEAYGRILLINWTNILGAATKKPIEIGTTNAGQKLTAMIWHVLTGDVRRLDLQFFLEPKQ